MDQNRFTALAHRTHTFSSPLSDATFEQLLAQLELGRDARVADFGCGNAHMLMRVCIQFRCHGTGFERNPHFVKMAREATDEHAPSGHIEIVEGEAEKSDLTGFDLVISSGARPFGESITANLQGLKGRTRAGGEILLGDGYWKQKPSSAYLEALGAKEDVHGSHADNVSAGDALGLVPLWATTASEAEWDAYEWRYGRSIEDFVAENPRDPDAEAMLKRIRSWRRTYLSMGRETLGFGFYLFRTP